MISKTKTSLRFLLILVLTIVSFEMQAQNITLDVTDKTLKEVLAQIESESEYIFIYNDKGVDTNRRISVNVSDASIKYVVSEILKGTDLSYMLDGRQITIFRKEKSVEKPDIVPAKPAKLVVKGRIVDNNGQSVIGASVIEKGTGHGVMADLDGNYSIEIEERSAVLVYSAMGYTTQEQKVSDRGNINVILREDFTQLEEVVVIGYGTQTKASITGALSIVDTDALTHAPVSSVTNVLAGSVPGVSTVQTSGQPGKDAASIYIRGTGSLSSSLSAPLVLVDGVERDFSQIDPNEVENMSILKDAASTAVFGVRGANGVILITTKRGKEGRMSISVSTNTGIQQPIALVEQVGSYEFANFWNTKMSNDGITDKSRYFSREAIFAYKTGADPIMYPNINWTDMMCNDVFLQSKNNINISGGGKNVSYFVSMGYLYQNGALKQLKELPYNNNYSYNRYNYRANLDVALTPVTKLKLNLGGHLGKVQEPYSVVESLGNPWVFATVWAVPMSGPGFIDGIRTIVPKGFIPSDVELRDAYQCFYGYGYRQNYNATLNVDVELEQNLDMITKGLSLSLKGSYDNVFSMDKQHKSWGAEYQVAYYKSYLEDKTKVMTDPDYDKTILFVQEGSNYSLSYSEEFGRKRNWYLEGKLNYERAFGDSRQHKVSAMLLYNQSRNYYPSTYAYIPRSYIGYVARATYSYADKYYADVNLGYNGSENFAPGKTRYGLFPSASLGWVITGEKFMKNVKFLDYMKIRASYGKVGNDISGARFLYMPEAWQADGSYSFGVDNPTSQEAYSHTTPGNLGVTWETASKQNYGIDATLFQNRLDLSLDYFFEHRTGILITPNSIPSVIAMTLPAMNIGVVDNSGYEVSVGWSDRYNNGFSYNLDANVSYARNKIIYMDEVRSKFDYQNQTGGSTGRHLLYQFERLYQYSDFIENEQGELELKPSLPQPMVKVYPGDAMYADISGDGKVDADDKKICGYSVRPEYIFGLNAGIKYKGFSLSTQWTGATHVSRLMTAGTYRIPFTNAGGRGLLKYFYEDCWTPENQNGTLPRASETSEAWNSEDSTLWLRDASYFRLKTLSVGYNFSGLKRLKAIGVKSIDVSFTGYNLLTFTGLKFMDPEAMPSDTGDYPLVKIYSFGLNITF